jgi:hypothetical protein
MADVVKVSMTPRELSRIDELALRQKNKLIEQRNDIAARLVNGEDYGALVIARKGYQTVHDVVGVECIQT